jgi:hypothetical protein
MGLKRGGGRTERARCAYCKTWILSPVQAIASSGGLLFDSIRCKERYLRRATLKVLSNVTRVARSRLKARTIGKAEPVYRKLGGRDWSTVKMLLSAVL